MAVYIENQLVTAETVKVQIDTDRVSIHINNERILQIHSSKIEVNDLRKVGLFDQRDNLLGTAEAAQLLRVSSAVFRNLVQRGLISEDCIEVQNGTRKYNSVKLLKIKENII